MVTNGDIGGRGVFEMVMSPLYFFNVTIFHISYYFHYILSKLELNNLLVKTFKQANANLTNEKAQKRVKEYYDTIKNKLFILKTLQTYHNFWYHYCS